MLNEMDRRRSRKVAARSLYVTIAFLAIHMWGMGGLQQFAYGAAWAVIAWNLEKNGGLV